MKTKYRITSLFISLIMMTMLVATTAYPIQDGMYPQVEVQLNNGKPIDAIMRDSLVWQGMTQQRIVKILYCLGVPGSDIKGASQANGIPDEVLVAGYKQSVEECNNTTVDPQNAASAEAGSFGAIPTGDQSGSFASPSTFK